MTSFTHATTTISQGTSFCAVGCNVAMNAADNPTIGYDVFEAIGAAEGTPTTSLCGYALANTISTSECSTVYINTFCAGGKSSTACFSSVPPVTSVSSASSTITSTSLGSPTASSSIRAASFGSQSSSSPFSGNATAPHNKAGVSAGAAAGIGIGAAIAGAILAALVLLLLAALRKKRRHETAAYGSRLPRHNPDIAGEPKRLSSIMKGGGLVVERDLPQVSLSLLHTVNVKLDLC